MLDSKKLMKNPFSSTEWAWMLYDLTTNSYATIILAAIFPIYFNVMVGHSALGLELKGFGSSFVMLVTAILCPILGALGDRKRMKKRFWASFAFSGAILTLGLAFVSSWPLLLLGYVLSNICYNTAMLFYDSFITDITIPERMHRVSTWAYAIGYFGGGTITLIITTILLFTMGTSNPLPVKISFALSALWWIVFSLPMLFRVKQVHYHEKTFKETTDGLLKQLGKTLREIWMDKGLRHFVLAYFFYIDGVATVITMATSYGQTLGLSASLMILALLTTQLVAVPFSILFGKLAGKFDAIKMILFAIGAYIVICLLGFYMGNMVETAHGAARTVAIGHAQVIFWIVAILVGTVQGGIQALSRSQFGQMIPSERSNEYFGFFNIFNRFASILGPLLMALTAMLTGLTSFGILSVVILFIAGAILLLTGRKYF